MRFDEKETGARIKELRERKHLTQYNLAAELHVSHGQMNKVEKGARMGSVDFYVSVAEFFCVSLDYLLTGKKNVEARTKIGVVLDILKDLESTL